MKQYVATVKMVGDWDDDQDPNEVFEKKTLKASSIKELRDKINVWESINVYPGSGDFVPGEVYEVTEGVSIGEFSPNMRLWGLNGKEIKIS